MFRKFLKDYFTFSRTERNGVIILVSIIAVLIAVRIAIPHIRKNVRYDFSEFQDEINQFEKSLNGSGKPSREAEASEKGNQPQFFDPNSASREEMENAGLDRMVVRNILKYREKGGRFNTREELKKIYGLDSAEYSDIEHYILIRADQTDTSGWQKAGSDDTGIARVDFNSRILINLNTADSAELESFYGIGPVLSARIVRYRDLLGGYASKRQLLEVYGMTIENFERIQDYVVADSAEIDFINLNEASLEELSRHPYLTVYQARSLIAYRETNGRFASTEEIVRNDLLPVDVYKKIRPYLVTE